MTRKNGSDAPDMSDAGGELWRRVTRTVRPLGRARDHAARETATVAASPPVRPPAVAHAVANAAARLGISPAAPGAPVVPVVPRPRAMDGAGLDGAWERRIGRGRIEPEWTIDLHGLTLDTAFARVDRTLAEAIADGVRVLLFITGRAGPGAAAGRAQAHGVRPRGMIRAKFPDWLAASRHHGAIAAIRAAHPRHGGAGALYVILRRPMRRG